MKQGRQHWYSKGLRFECTRCGNCCGGAPGTVRISRNEASVLAKHLDMLEEEFLGVYTRRVNVNELSLRDKSNLECIFYESTAGCTVYAHRPRQCRTWPMWRSVVGSPERWAEEANECPGMNNGPAYSAESVAKISSNDGTFGGSRRAQEARAVP